MKQHLPNALTCLNLLCGCVALSIILSYGADDFIVHGKELSTAPGSSPWALLLPAAYLIGIAAIADFFDGLVARALRVSSPIGKDLDSLADMVSFGVVPGAILFKLLQHVLPSTQLPESLAYLGFVVSIFSALRLAKFNNDTRQSDSFIGVPTPANTMLIMSLPVILAADRFGLSRYILNPWVLLGLTFVMSGLLVAELPLFALKFKNFKWQDNSLRFVFLALAVVLLVLLQAAAVPLIILLYVALSVLRPARG
ncbi:CDP-diacylglycerol--serine O-phosphatidyltransferase [Hymenobacter busanensis]|uniref:CDP-diacylglycerol--serine O-phosphatidyltransferase n=1 Tax=Hymenobacter busanensis TaxID=2607656 RepID=A0A7L5A3B2_9BACT|nr:CDP-alcohol phosphatidyltransferase family protein [Hymenobacter busanensis]KAA9325365.1 CDP-diacylglycerol--serine O-phosphatidyltransferase [Hymenobacter busanensis]QHJ09676.1 CDP-diacylglycerol--serine O-phosphatidyltransferase [Hymenobacter busanensis]